MLDLEHRPYTLYVAYGRTVRAIRLAYDANPTNRSQPHPSTPQERAARQEVLSEWIPSLVRGSSITVYHDTVLRAMAQDGTGLSDSGVLDIVRYKVDVNPELALAVDAVLQTQLVLTMASSPPAATSSLLSGTCGQSHHPQSAQTTNMLAFKQAATTISVRV